MRRRRGFKESRRGRGGGLKEGKVACCPFFSLHAPTGEEAKGGGGAGEIVGFFLFRFFRLFFPFLNVQCYIDLTSCCGFENRGQRNSRITIFFCSSKCRPQPY